MKKVLLHQAILDSLGIIGPTKLPLCTYKGTTAYPLPMLGKVGTLRVLKAIDFVNLPKVAARIALIFEGTSELTPTMLITQLCEPANSLITLLDGQVKAPNLVTGKEWTDIIGHALRIDDYNSVDHSTIYTVVKNKAATNQPIAIAPRGIKPGRGAKQVPSGYRG